MAELGAAQSAGEAPLDAEVISEGAGSAVRIIILSDRLFSDWMASLCYVYQFKHEK